MLRIRRREFITLLGSAAAWPVTARAQQPDRARRIGVLMATTEDDAVGQSRVAAFRQRLHDLGWIDGRNVQIFHRWALPGSPQLQTAAIELAALAPDLLFAGATVSVEAHLKKTRSISIVFAVVSDPIGSGFVASLARPGGNVTGFTNYEATLGQKWLEILKEIAPGMARAAAIFNPKTTAGAGDYYLRPLDAAARSIGVKVIATPFVNVDEIEPAIADFAREPKGGLLVLPDSSTTANRQAIISGAARHRLPAVYSARFFTTDGGLISYSADDDDGFRGAAGYVDRILKGEKPRDLPVQAPTKFQLVINFKTAKTLGLEVPPTLLIRADELIE
jgi:putative ABC transport system substrate-binding protein